MGVFYISASSYFRARPNLKKINTPIPFHKSAKRSIDPGGIMDSSGEPVSKFRVKVFVPGRLEYILVSGAPTYLGHRSLFFKHYFRVRKFDAIRAPGDLLDIFPDVQPGKLITCAGQSRLLIG